MSDFELLLTADSRGLVSGDRALDQIASTAEKTERQVTRASGSMSKGLEQVGQKSIYASQQLRMQAMQLSQVAQQASVTGNVMQAIAIQLPDLALGFGPIGILAGAAAGAVLSYFSAIMDNEDPASDALQEQEALIRRVADTWGDAVPALKAYVDQLERAKTTADLLAASDQLASESWATASNEVRDLNVELAALVQDLSQAGAEENTILTLQSAWSKVSKAVKENREDTEAMRNVQGSLADAVSQTGIPAIDLFATRFTNLAQTIAGATRQSGIFRNEAIQALTVGQGQLGALSPMWSENGKLMTEEQFKLPPIGPVPGSRGTPELSGFPWEEFNRQRRGSSRTPAISQAERESKAVGDLIKELHEELSLVNAGDAAKRAAAASRQAGSAATGDERKEIISLTEAIYQEEQARDRVIEQMDFYKSATHGVLDDVRSALDDGKISWQEWGDIASGVLDKVLDKLQDGFVDSLFDASTPGKGGGAILGKTFNLNLRSEQ
jgi:hypothetical protein